MTVATRQMLVLLLRHLKGAVKAIEQLIGKPDEGQRE
jgi:hypothetical protein